MFDLSLGFIAFAAGSELFFKEIKGTFNSIKWNTLSSILITFSVGFILVFLAFNTLVFFDNIQFDIKIYLSLLCASIFVARSPASAIAVINELRAKGKFTSTSMGVLCLSDFGVILLFAIIFSLIKSIDSGSLQILSMIIIIFEIIISVLKGKSISFCPSTHIFAFSSGPSKIFTSTFSSDEIMKGLEDKL